MSELCCQRSRDEFEKAKALIPGGAHSSHRPLLPGEFPTYMDRGNGSHLWDIDGNEYIDYLLGFGAITLGHADPAVNEVAIGQLNKGMMLSRSGLIQNELAREIHRLVPCAEMMHFFKDGSGATSAAVRIARAYTKRDKIIRWGYNGWHDWCCDLPPTGVPEVVRNLTFKLEYNDLDALEALLTGNRGEIACIIMEPALRWEPMEGFLQGVQNLAREHGALFILDEIKTFPRMSLSGGQGYFGLVPDMATVGKGMANGFPIAAVTGKREVMESAVDLRLSATFNVELVSMAAALATLREIQARDAVTHIWNMVGDSCRD